MGTRGIARVQVVAAAALFSTGGAAIKAASLTGWQVASFRSGIAAVVVWLMLRPTRDAWSRRALIVGAAYAGTMTLFVLANKLTTAANSIFLQSAFPLYVLLLGPWVLREPTRRRDLVFMAFVLAGLLLFFVGTEAPRATAPNPLAGNMLAIASGLFWALTIVGLRWMGRVRPLEATAAGGAVSGAADVVAGDAVDGAAGGAVRGAAGGAAGGSAGAGAASGVAAAVVAGNVIAFLVGLPRALPVHAIGPRDWIVVGYLGVFQIALAYVFLTAGLRKLPALEASVLLLIEPALNPIWAWLVHHERPGAWALLGGALIVGTTVARTWWESRRVPASA